jgi:hypothetical protein
MGGLVRVSRGLWRPAADVESLAARCAALLNVLPPGTVVAGTTAAQLHGMWLPTLPLRRIEMIVPCASASPRDVAASVRPEVRARRRTLHPDEVTQCDGLGVTSPERTWCDLGEALVMPDLVAAGDCVLRGLSDIAGLRDAVGRAHRLRGVVKVRAALAMLDARSRSRPESHLRYALAAGGLPVPEVNSPIFSPHGEWLAEPDLHYPHAQLALEYNGAEHASPKRMRRDITRDLDYQWDGWRVITLGPVQVFDRPDQVVSLVRHVLLERDPAAFSR